MVGAVRDATVVVALDFGTTFSGFAYAHKGSPDNVYKFYEWPDSSEGCGKPYCKTETSLYYVQPEDGSSETYELKAWGWSALAHHSEAVQKAARAHRQRELSQERSEGAAYNVGFYITRFKLHLAGEENVRKSRMATRPVSAEALPPGLTVDRCVEDYLSKISAFALDHLRGRFGDQLTMKDVQWCLTVPAIWDDSAKQRMKICAEKAGMVAGAYTPKDAEASPHPLLPILEPEAASFYCWNKAEHLNLRLYDHFIVADVGGGTTDIVVHSRANGDSQLRIREVQVSSGALCGVRTWTATSPGSWAVKLDASRISSMKMHLCGSIFKAGGRL